MTTGKRLWVVVADGARARFFVPGSEKHGFAPTGPGVLASDSVHVRDLKSDRPGRAFSSTAAGVRHAIEPKHDYHKLEKRKFAHLIAEALDQAHAARAFDQL